MVQHSKRRVRVSKFWRRHTGQELWSGKRHISNAYEPKLLASPFTRCRWCSLVLFKTFQNLCQCGRRALQMDCPDVQSYLGSRLDFLCVARATAINSFFFCFFQGPKYLFSLDFLLLTARCSSFLVLVIHGLPLWSFDSLVNSLADGVPVLIL